MLSAVPTVFEEYSKKKPLASRIDGDSLRFYYMDIPSRRRKSEALCLKMAT